MDSLTASPSVCSKAGATRRKRARVPNFTAQEKAVLRYFVKRRPIIESKKTDNKTAEKKKRAWDTISTEFNSNIKVCKRDTLTLKRAWRNMKSTSHKAGAVERRSTINTEGATSVASQPPHQGAIAKIDEETDPLFFCKIENSCDSDSVSNNSDSESLSQICNKLKPGLSKAEADTNSNLPDNTKDDDNKTWKEQVECEPPEKVSDVESADGIPEDDIAVSVDNNKRTPTDHVRRDAVMRFRHFERKKKIEMRTLKAKLEVQEIKIRAAQLEEETNKTNLEIAKLKLKDLKSRLQN